MKKLFPIKMVPLISLLVPIIPHFNTTDEDEDEDEHISSYLNSVHLQTCINLDTCRSIILIYFLDVLPDFFDLK